MRALVRSLVEEVTSNVHECESGEEAIDLYARFRPDCVLMDLGLGGMDGLAATRAILRLEPEARVIVVTGQDEKQFRTEAKAAGARGFLLKEDLLELPALLWSATREEDEEGGSE